LDRRQIGGLVALEPGLGPGPVGLDRVTSGVGCGRARRGECEPHAEQDAHARLTLTITFMTKRIATASPRRRAARHPQSGRRPETLPPPSSGKVTTRST